MSEPPPKKKRKPGGSFCAMGGCSNRSSRDTRSSLSRDFLRYIPLPKDSAMKEAWLKRMKRDLQSWNPSAGTKICSDHFFEIDFRPDDLARHRNNTNAAKNTHIRLRPGTSVTETFWCLLTKERH